MQHFETDYMEKFNEQFDTQFERYAMFRPAGLDTGAMDVLLNRVQLGMRLWMQMKLQDIFRHIDHNIHMAAASYSMQYHRGYFAEIEDHIDDDSKKSMPIVTDFFGHSQLVPLNPKGSASLQMVLWWIDRGCPPTNTESSSGTFTWDDLNPNNKEASL